MNILQINTIDNRGGAAKAAYSLKNKLEKLEHTTSMFVRTKYSTDDNIFKIQQENKLSEISKKLIKKDLLNYIEKKFHSLLSNDIEFFHSGRILETEEFQNADIVHCHNLHGNYFNLKLLQKISKLKPVVWTLHDMWAITGHCAHSFDCEKWQKVCYKCASLNLYPALKWDNCRYLWNKKKNIYNNSKLNIVVPSLWLKGKIEKSILKNQNITLIYNGIDDNVFKQYDKNKIRQKLNLPIHKKIIIFLAQEGKNSRFKGWDYTEKIINHCKNNENILFLCIGGKKEDEQFNSDNIKYIKYIKDEALLAQYYSASDIFLFTSLAENFPLVILEALACGTPIVSFNIGGVKEAVIHKQNGYIAEYKNTNDLINGIEYIFGLNKDKLNKMSQNSIQRARKNFTLDIMTDNYLKFYKICQNM